ncbi:conjugal transfer protein TrbH [Pseudomonas sp. CFBP 13602]|uniref:conjugal transfer protein TrbH n=1 Tax=Pseudomonas sp. CFBP 13602 TaxID=2774039 RepID=UPI00177D98C7|nr:conjugal transfer protein TrbH [Pseudomonas sp. CFBP 13602]MBD8829023.1 conjugal transfer protein TrbH [Pseudomonas sp. CFBP 13602]
MRKLFLISAAIMALSGCASNSPYGNYSTAPAASDKAMATDTVTHLVKLYPPALTRWNIMQPTTDAYGTALVELLRSRGYSVKEYAPVTDQKTQPATQAASVPGVDLRYVVDSLAPAVDLYRVTIVVGGQPISRAYIPQKNGAVVAAGSWARKE